MKAALCYIGVDLGTSGCRAVAIDRAASPVASARVPLAGADTPALGHVEQDPALWWQAVRAVLTTLGGAPGGLIPAVICVDGTSGTLLLARLDGTPSAPALMYNDGRAVEEASRIAQVAPVASPARGPSSGLAKLLYLCRGLPAGEPALALHQADWISGRLIGRFGVSDWNNALKLGYDAERLCWPRWVRDLLPPGVRLPDVIAPGTLIGTLAPEVAVDLGFATTTRVAAGTTDSTAAAIAAGLRAPGDAVTCLGSTLVLKILSERPICDARLGVYSQRFGDLWLAGGASNSGGAVLRQHFSDTEIAELSAGIDPDRPCGLGYYPLARSGERFPVNDPTRQPRLEPRPADRRLFLQGILEGMAAIETEGYRRLRELGAPAPTRVLTVGGGSVNPVWTRIRQRMLGIEVAAAAQQEAAFGSALLARGLAPFDQGPGVGS